jgi:superfamily II DNA or RNA helicase
MWPDHILEGLQAEYTVPNPKYQAYLGRIAARPYAAKYIERPDKDICLWEEFSGDRSFVVPLTAMKWLQTRYPVEWLQTDCHVDLVRPPAAFDLNPEFVAWEHQNKIVRHVGKFNMGLFASPTGSGKTTTCGMLIHKHQTRTLIAVPTEALVQQTVDKMRWLLGTDIGVWAGGVEDIRPVTVTTYQTQIRKDLTEYKDEFGMVIADEIHMSTGDQWRRVLQSYNSWWRYGCSATIERKDKLENVLFKVLGSVTYRVSRQDLEGHKILVRPEIISIPTEFKLRGQYSAYDFSQLLAEVLSNEARNEFILDKIVELGQMKYGAVVTKRVEHAQYLEKQLAAAGINTVLYHGQLRAKEKREAIERLRTDPQTLTIATQEAIGTGFDVPAWEVLFVVAPFNNENQAIQLCGRLTRACQGKTKSTLYDFVDDKDPQLRRYSERRLRSYLKDM